MAMEYITCLKCTSLFKPFYFGDKPLNRRVLNECPKCGNEIVFNPSELSTLTEDELSRMKLEGTWIETQRRRNE